MSDIEAKYRYVPKFYLRPLDVHRWGELLK